MQMLHMLVVFGESWSDFVHLHPSFSLGLVSRPWGAWIAMFGKTAFIPWSTAKSLYLGLFHLQSVQVQCLCWAPVSKRAENTQAMQSSLFPAGAQPGAGAVPGCCSCLAAPQPGQTGLLGFRQLEAVPWHRAMHKATSIQTEDVLLLRERKVSWRKQK